MTATREMRIDCHVHSGHSPDGNGTISQIIAAAQQAGLDGVAITDHNSLRSHTDIKALKDPPILVIPGVEVSTADGHCLGLGVRAAIPPQMGLEETLEAIVAAGGVAVPSHPCRRVHGVGRATIDRCAETLAAIEVYNGHDGDRKSHKAELLAIHHRLGGTGGSDAHRPGDVGHAYATFSRSLSSVDEALDQIDKGKSWGEGVPFSRTHHIRKNMTSLWKWTRRGFRSI